MLLQDVRSRVRHRHPAAAGRHRPVGHRPAPRRRRPSTDVALRVLADHARTMTFLVNDGVVPSNEDRGYVLRRIIRRAVRFAYLLGVERRRPARASSPSCIDAMGDAYPDLAANRDFVTGIIEREEGGFRPTLTRGVTLLDETFAKDAGRGARRRRLQAPRHLRLPARGHPGDRRRARRRRRPRRLRRRSCRSSAPAPRRPARRATSTPTARASSRSSTSTAPPSSSAARRTRPRPPCSPSSRATTATASIFLDRTPVLRRVRRPGRRHRRHHAPTPARPRCSTPPTRSPACTATSPASSTARIEPGQEATAAIDVERRDAIRRNHTGTHVLHWALRKVLGEHVKQQGSLVDPDRLRFDFGPADALTPDQIREIEDLANARDPRQRPGPPLRDHQGRGRQARRHRLLRRQVRRHRPRARGRSALDRAVRRHPRAGPRRHRPGQDRVGGVDRRQPAPHRGRHRHRPDRAPARRGAPAGRAGRGAQRARRRGRRRRPQAAGGDPGAPRRGQGPQAPGRRRPGRIARGPGGRRRRRRAGRRPRARRPPRPRPRPARPARPPGRRARHRARGRGRGAGGRRDARTAGSTPRPSPRRPRS